MSPEYAPQPLQAVSLAGADEISPSAADSHDSIILLFTNKSSLGDYPVLTTAVPSIQTAALNDAAFDGQVTLLTTQSGRRFVASPTGPLNRDYDDVRRYADAAVRAVRRLRASGATGSALVLVEAPPRDLAAAYSNYLQVSMLAVLAELYDSLEAREHGGARCAVDAVRFAVLGSGCAVLDGAALVKDVLAIEAGRRLARDLGECDPERMSPLNCAAAIQAYFKSQRNVSVEAVADVEHLQAHYPLLMAVARASLPVPRHRPCVVKLEYRSPDQARVEEELFLVGKGVTFDTGGADLKVNGHMVGMSRDKCGAAAVAGFMATLAELSPVHLNVTAELAMVRNSIGADAYVCDEIIRSRAGVRVRVVNTDAEGRMAMADLLAECKEKALRLPDPSKARLFTCATLTGHVVRAYGPYAAAMDNGPAARASVSGRLRAAGEAMADPFEVSRIRREDYEFCAPRGAREDLVQCNSAPSTMTNRGHMVPFPFMTIASGLEAHGSQAEPAKRLCYTHLDIAGAAEEVGIGALGKATGSPIVALTTAFVSKALKRI
jgi:leucyl aminopeptidase